MSILGLFSRNKLDLVGNSDGTMYRYDLGRTGFAKTEPLRKLQGQKWEYECKSNIISSPVVSGGTLFLLSKDGCFHAIDVENGKLKWKFTAKIEFSAGESSPAITDDIVYFMSEDYLYALDANKGRVKWKFRTPNGGKACPIVYDKMVFFGCLGRFYAVGMTKGKEIWSAEISENLVDAPAIDINNQLIWLTAGRNIFAFNLRTGIEQWRYDTRDFMTFSPSVYDGLVFVGAHDRTDLKILEIAQGNVREFSLGAGLWSPVTLAYSQIYANVYNVLEVWQLSRPSFEVNRMWYYRLSQGSFNTSPTVVNDIVYIGSDRYLYAIDATSRSELWKHDVGESVVSPPLVNQRIVYFATYSGRIIALY